MGKSPYTSNIERMRKDGGMIKSDHEAFTKLIAKRLKKIVERNRKKQKTLNSQDESHIVALNQQIESRVKELDSAIRKVEKNDGNLDALVDLSANRLLYDNNEIIDAARELCEPKEMAELLKEWSGSGNRPQIVSMYYKDNVFRPKGHMYACFYFYYGMLHRGQVVHCETQLLHVNMQETERLSHITYKLLDEYNAKVKAGTNTPTDDITVKGYLESLLTQNINDLIRTGLVEKMDPELINPNSQLIDEIRQTDPKYFYGLNKLHETLAELKKAEAAYTAPIKRVAASNRKKIGGFDEHKQNQAGQAVRVHVAKNFKPKF